MRRKRPDSRITPDYRFELKDVKEPNLLRDMFPYVEVPKIFFADRLIPMSLPDDFWITDTTFRDGQQARPPYTPEQILKIFDMMHRLGGPNGVIRQSEFFLYSEKDRKALELCMDRRYPYPEITGWIRAKKEDFKLVREAGLKETGILVSCSDYHIYLKLKKTRKQALNEYLDVVRASLDAGIVPRCHLEDITRADFYGFVIPFVNELMRLSEESGIPVKIRACDTMGYAVPYPGAALPRGVADLIYGLIHYGGVPSHLLEWHGHNDFHKVLANAATAWLYGCCAANGTLLGFGERTGNPPIEGLIIEYMSLKGKQNGVDPTVITEIANYFQDDLGYQIPSNYPFVGEDFNVTKAGIHADGVLKNEEIYNIFDTRSLLNRPLGVIITDKSGVAGISYWINTHLRQTGGRTVDKHHPGIARIHRWVSEQYEQGRITAISNEEILHQARKHLPEYFVSDLDKIKAKALDMAQGIVEKSAATPDLRSMKRSRMEKTLRKLVGDNPFIQFAYITNTDGIKVTSHITQIGDKAKYQIFSEKEDFSDRSWFIEPMKDGKTHASDLYTSKATGVLAITVSTPIFDKEDEIIGVFGVDMRFEDLIKSE
ncbi:MAG: histone-lysine N-methyltransferase [Nitrospirae bacterium CG2_30_53_67]|nr:MAG: histone-lysine N-methyltransferase [Nitrospirae bacterium CG2_30_53_67]